MRFLKSMGLLFALSLCFSYASLVNATDAKTIKLYMTVDWEGRSLDDANMQAMQQFRQKFPNIPMLQLLNPAYFLQDHPDNKRLTTYIKSTFLPGDTHGLHVHAWKSLTKHCGVAYQHTPSFADTDERCTVGDCGYTVSLEYAYSQQDLTRLISCGNQVLMDNGFNRSVHFRAGGWQLGPKLIAALEANGFVWDSSEIDADLLLTRWHEKSGMVKMLNELHPDSTPLDQPYALSKQLMEYPNNAALADYTTTKQIVALFEGLINANKTVMVLGFHQETAADFLPEIEGAVPQMEKIAKEKGWQIKWGSH